MMDAGRIHRAASSDGTEIAGRVEGQGPPLAFVHGGLGDGEASWSSLAPLLSERFTCYLMSTRGRGRSQDATDHSRERVVQDVAAFVESIGEPAGVVGHSSGGALEAAAQTAAVWALALYEPTLFDFGPRDPARDEDAFARGEAAVAEGRPVDATRIFFEDVALVTGDELGVMEKRGMFDIFAINVPVDLRELAQSGPPRLPDLGVLDRVRTPVLLLQGSRTAPFYRGVVGRLTERLRDPHVREIPDAGHLGPQLAPEPIAEELIRFFAGVRPRA